MKFDAIERYDRERAQRLLALGDTIGGGARTASLTWPSTADLNLRDLADPGASGLIGRDSVSLKSQLSSRSAILAAGAQFINFGVPRDVALPEIDRDLAASWNATAADAAPTISASVAVPHRVSAELGFSTQLILTSPAIGLAFVESQLLSAVAAAIDDAAMTGTGSDMPTGILVDAAIPEVTQAGGSLAAADLLDMEDTLCSERSAGPESGLLWFMSSDVRKACRSIEIGGSAAYRDGKLLDHRAVVIPGAPANSLVFGRAENLLVAQWGALDFKVFADRVDQINGFQLGLVTTYLDTVALDPDRGFVRLAQA